MSTRASRASTSASSRTATGPVQRWQKRPIAPDRAPLRLHKWAKATEGDDAPAARSTRGRRSASSTLVKLPGAVAGGAAPPAARQQTTTAAASEPEQRGGVPPPSSSSSSPPPLGRAEGAGATADIAGSSSAEGA